MHAPEPIVPPRSADATESRENTRTRDLTDLLGAVGIPDPGVGRVPVAGISCDPLHVQAGEIYVALPGTPGAEREAVLAAIARGVVAVLMESGLEAPGAGTVLPVADPAGVLARLLDQFHGRPSEDVAVLAITGTSGKSTTARLTEAALRAAGLAAGLAEEADLRPVDVGHGAARLQARLRALRRRGRRACVVEASSRAIVEGHLDGVRLTSAVLTNLGSDHLAYHGCFEEYLDAKLELFRRLPAAGVAMLNRDDPAWELFAGETRARVATWGFGGDADVRARITRLDLGGTALAIDTPLGDVRLRSRLVGAHHAACLVAALAASVTLGADPVEAAAGLERVTSLENRFERVPVTAPFSVFLDAARTPHALGALLEGVRPLCDARLWVVFGCAPDVESEDRPRLARVAERHADAVMVTGAANEPMGDMGVIREVMRGLRTPSRALLEPDRGRAYRIVSGLAGAGDVIVIADAGGPGSVWQDRWEVEAAHAGA